MSFIIKKVQLGPKVGTGMTKWSNSGRSLGIGDQRLLQLLYWILQLILACLLWELCPSIIILLFLYCILLLLQFLMKSLIIWWEHSLCTSVPGLILNSKLRYVDWIVGSLLFCEKYLNPWVLLFFQKPTFNLIKFDFYSFHYVEYLSLARFQFKLIFFLELFFLDLLRTLQISQRTSIKVLTRSANNTSTFLTTLVLGWLSQRSIII